MNDATKAVRSPAFVASTEALRTYWADDKLEKSTLAKGEQVGRVFDSLVESLPGTPMRSKGRGLARGLQARYRMFAAVFGAWMALQLKHPPLRNAAPRGAELARAELEYINF